MRLSRHDTPTFFRHVIVATCMKPVFHLLILPIAFAFAWPPVSHSRVLIESPHKTNDETAYSGDVIEHFMTRACRRPLVPGELEAKFELFNRLRPDKPSFVETIKVPLAEGREGIS